MIKKGGFKDYTGEKFVTKEGCSVTVVKCTGTKKITIMFENGFVIENIQYSALKRGEIKNPYHPSVCGVGYFGVGVYKSQINKKQTKVYKTWHAMLHRCYDEKTQKRYPTYKDCIVDEQWHNFQNFAKWFDENYIDGFDLDKDILVKGNRVYSTETCCFVPGEINQSFREFRSKLENLPPWVFLDKRTGNYKASVKINGILMYFGMFKYKEEAFRICKIAKEKEIHRLANKWRGQITERCYLTLINYKIIVITD